MDLAVKRHSVELGHGGSMLSAFGDQPKRLGGRRLPGDRPRWQRFSAGLVIQVATSRARVTHCGVTMERRSATNASWVVSENGRPEPTPRRVTAAAQIGSIRPIAIQSIKVGIPGSQACGRGVPAPPW